MIFDGSREEWLDPEPWPRWVTSTVIAGLAALLWALVFLLILGISSAFAQNQPRSCSGTAEATAANITLGGPAQNYITIANPSVAATLWLSTTTTAAVNASGSFSLAVGGFVTLPGMATVSIIASAPSTPYTCFYR